MIPPRIFDNTEKGLLTLTYIPHPAQSSLHPTIHHQNPTLTQSSELSILAPAILASKVANLASDAEEALKVLIDLQMPDATWRPQAGVKGSIGNAKTALQALAAYTDKPMVGEALEKSKQLLPSGDDEGDGTAVDPTLLVYLRSRVKKENKAFKKKQVMAITSSLLPLQYAGAEDGLESLALCIEALQVLDTADQAAPLVHISATGYSGKKVGLSVTDVFGQKVNIESVSLKSLRRQGADKALDTADFKASSTPTTQIDFSGASADLKSGRYSAEVVVGLTEPAASSITATVRFVVPRSFSVSGVHAGVSQSKKVSLNELTKVSAQNKWNGGSASAAGGDYVHVAFSLQQSEADGSKTASKAAVFQMPHQCFVKLTHIASGTDSFFVGAAEGGAAAGTDGSMRYKVAVALNKEIETLSHHSGEYVMSVLVADAAASDPVEFVVGSLSISVPANVDKIAPLYTTSLLHASDNTLVSMPEIEHVMRPPEKRASAFMSALFTGLSLVPLVGFILFVASQSPNLQRLTSLSSWVYIASIGGCIFLCLAYWFNIPFFSFYEVIRYGCVVVPVTAVVSRWSLLK